MKIAIGLAVKNEAEWLEKTLVTYYAHFDGIIAMVNESTDNTKEFFLEIGERMTTVVLEGPADQLVLHSRNKVIKKAEEMGYDAILIMDGDEALDPIGCILIREYFESEEFIALPRIEFVKDFEHYDPFLYSDIQGRGFHLNKGYHFRGEIHEFVFKGNDEQPAMVEHYGVVIPDAPIYHYGKCKTKEELYIKYTNYDLRSRGLEPIKEVPPGTEINPAWYWGNVRKFRGDHPLKK